MKYLGKHVFRKPGLLFECFFVVMFSGLIALLGFMHNQENWDSIPYSSLALQKQGLSQEEIHYEVYEYLRVTLREEKFKNLVGIEPQNDFRKIIATDPASLNSLYGAYASRFFYIHLTSALVGLGLHPFIALKIISAFFAGISVILIWLIARDLSIPKLLTVAVTPLLGMLQVSTLSTPDSFACAALLLITLLILKQKHSILLGGVLMLPLIRPELLIFSLLYLWSPIFAKSLIVRILSTVTLFAQTLLVSSLTNSWNPAKALNFYLLEFSLPVSEIPGEIEFGEYFHKLASKLLYADPILMMLIILSIFIALRFRHVEFDLRVYSCIVLSYTISRFIIFPSTELRFFVAPIIIIVLILIYSFSSHTHTETIK